MTQQLTENVVVPPRVGRPLSSPRPRRRIGTTRVMRTYDPEGDRQKVAVLTGALPWLKEFHGNVVVVKYGGHAMGGEGGRRAFAGGSEDPRSCRHPPLVVVGGGPQA